MTTRVALDLLGGDRAPDVIVDGAVLALAEQPGLEVLLVGPVDLAAGLLRDRDVDPSVVTLVAASQVVGMDEDPARAVRAKRDATVRVAARLVRDGFADATVSIGSTGAAMAAAVFTLGRIPGVTRPALALMLPSPRGSVVFLDAGANIEAGPDLLAQFALAGSAYATVRLGIDRPRVGLLTIGEEAGKGDELRRSAHELLAALPIDYVGSVEGRHVALGGVADVVVTDGFTGNVLLKGIEGAFTAMRESLLAALGQQVGLAEGSEAAAARFAGLVDETSANMGAERLGGAVLLGVNGVSVVGHGSSSPRAVASCLAAARQAQAEGLVPRLTEALAGLVARRREAAGLAPRDPA